MTDAAYKCYRVDLEVQFEIKRISVYQGANSPEEAKILAEAGFDLELFDANSIHISNVTASAVKEV